MRRHHEVSKRGDQGRSRGPGIAGEAQSVDEGPRKRKRESQDRMGTERALSDRSSKLVPRLTKRLLVYLLLFVAAQLGIFYFFLNNFKMKNVEDKNLAPTKSKFVEYPINYRPPCQIKAKEALSAINRVVTPGCKRELTEVACKSESEQLYSKTLPNLCPAEAASSGSNLGTYLGCYRDEFQQRILQGSFSRLADNSRGRCVQLCTSSGFKFSGTQYGRECFCGNVAPSDHILLKDEFCDKPCTGDASQTCGGYLTMNIYETNIHKKKSELAESLNSEDNVRIVYLLTVNGRAVRQLKRLIRKLFDGRNYFYVHVDARQDFMFSEIKKLADKFPEHIRVAENRFSTIWGGASLLRMLVKCMSDLLAMDDWKWDFVINLSESDYPVKKPELLAQFLSENREKNFVKSHGRDSQVFIKKQGLDRTFHECDTHMFRLGVRNLPEGITVDGGSDWVCINRQFVSYVVNGDDELLRGLRVLFNYSLLPAESFFHTTLKNSEFCSSYVNNNLRMTNWKRHLGCKCQHKSIVDWCGCSPNDFLPEDWAKLNSTRTKDIFFARKFEPIVNQGILDLVDYNLLDQKTENAKGYWQNIFHHFDSSPKPDPAVITLAQILSESAIEVFGLEFRRLVDVSSFHYDDIFEGIVLTFSASSDQNESEHLFEAFVRVKLPETNIDFRGGDIAVGTDFDPKEILFRNFFSAIGPNSKPILTYDFVESLIDRNVSVKIIWTDPIGQVAHVHNIEALNNSDVHDAVELKLQHPLFPGIWSVTFLIQEEFKNIAAKIPFLVTPLLPVNDELRNEEYLKSLHRRKRAQKPSPDSNVVGVEFDADQDLIRQSDLNAEKSGPELKLWISELASSFYNVEAVCRRESDADIDADLKLALLPKCDESEWSITFPDVKSHF